MGGRVRCLHPVFGLSSCALMSWSCIPPMTVFAGLSILVGALQAPTIGRGQNEARFCSCPGAHCIATACHLLSRRCCGSSALAAVVAHLQAQNNATDVVMAPTAGLQRVQGRRNEGPHPACPQPPPSSRAGPLISLTPGQYDIFARCAQACRTPPPHPTQGWLQWLNGRRSVPVVCARV